ncbi:MAG: cytochrome P450 [Opitutaceae bacterium]
MSSCPHDPFERARMEKGVLAADLDGDTIPMILRHKDVREASRNWKVFSSDAPFRVPIPSEEKNRSVRQLPIETDPPEHTEWRAIVEPFFRRPKDPDFIEKMSHLIGRLVQETCRRDRIEVVRDFALPLQSRALTHLLNVPESEAEIWIGWAVHVFRDGEDGEPRGMELEDYIHAQIDRAAAHPGDDFFSALTRAEYRGRRLSRDEMVGFANLTFAGGRDTIINTVAWIVAYVAEHPEALAALRDDPRLIVSASEEFVRVISPLTHIGRVCPVDTEVHGLKVKAGERVSLCWASANFDESVFDAPQEIRLDRRPNAHMAYGSGPHLCLGAFHARLIIRTLLQTLCDRVGSVTILDFEERAPSEADFQRSVGYESLTVRMTGR